MWGMLHRIQFVCLSYLWNQKLWSNSNLCFLSELLVQDTFCASSASYLPAVESADIVSRSSSGLMENLHKDTCKSSCRLCDSCSFALERLFCKYTKTHTNTTAAPSPTNIKSTHPFYHKFYFPMWQTICLSSSQLQFTNYPQGTLTNLREHGSILPCNSICPLPWANE